MVLERREVLRMIGGALGLYASAAVGWLIGALGEDPPKRIVYVVLGVMLVAAAAFGLLWYRLNRHRLFGPKVDPRLKRVSQGPQHSRNRPHDMLGWYVAVTAKERIPQRIRIKSDAAPYEEESSCDGADLVAGYPTRPASTELLYEFSSAIAEGSFIWFAVFNPSEIRITDVEVEDSLTSR